MSQTWHRMGLLASWLGLSAAFGCGATPPCRTRADCEGGAECLAGRCSACPRACAAGELCLQGDCRAQRCGDTPCRADEACVDGACRGSACAGVTCGEGEACAQGRCYPRECGGEACGDGEVCVAQACAEPSCVGVSCTADEVCAGGECYPASCAGVLCAEGNACEDGRCVSRRCAGVVCPEGAACAEGRCLEASCDGVTCAGGEVCQGGACLDAACVGRSCPGGAVCAKGQCLAQDCAGVSCAEGNVCEAGRCVSRRCVGVECGAGSSCADGRCVAEACEDVTCGEGEACVGGACLDAACVGARCAAGEVCLRGRCLAEDCPDAACAEGNVCEAGGCVSARCVAVECLPDFVCADGACLPTSCGETACEVGQGCFGDLCVDPGCVGRQCPVPEICTAGACAARPCSEAEPCPEGEFCVSRTCRLTCDDPRAGSACTSGLGACQARGTRQCSAAGTVCSAVPGTPAAEVCDGLDNDCDGLVDDLAGCVSTAGGGPTSATGALAEARFLRPGRVLALPDGDLLVADWWSNVIQRVSLATGQVTTEAGIVNRCGMVQGGPGVGQLCAPAAMARASDGTIYIADDANNRIRALKDGVLSLVAGTGGRGGANGAASAATFNQPCDVALAGGLLYIADAGNCQVRLYDGANVSTAAGTSCGAAADGAAASARFSSVCSVAANASGDTLYIGDCGNALVRVLSGGVVTTLAGTTEGMLDGPGTGAQFAWPWGMSWSPQGLFVADQSNNRLRRIDLSGSVPQVTTAAGTGAYDLADGDALADARLQGPAGVTVVGETAYFVDWEDRRLRKLDLATNEVTTLAGGPPSKHLDGARDQATMDQPWGLALDPATGIAYFTETTRVRGMYPDGRLVTLAGAEAGHVDGTLVQARFSFLEGLEVGADGRLVVVDEGWIRLVDPAGDSVTTLAGSGGDCNPADAPALSAGLCNPTDVALGPGGEVYLAESAGLVRKLEDGQVTLVAGAVADGFADGTGAAARFNVPMGIALGPDGLLYVADALNNRIRTVDPASGAVATVLGTSTCDDVLGALSSARICEPLSLAWVGSSLYLGTLSGVRELAGGQLLNVAGRLADTGWEDGAAASAGFYMVYGLAPSPGGGLYVTDIAADRIRRIGP